MKPNFILLIVLIERFPQEFGHYTARQNTAQVGGCKKRTLFSLDLPNLRQGQGA